MIYVNIGIHTSLSTEMENILREECQNVNRSKASYQVKYSLNL